MNDSQIRTLAETMTPSAALEHIFDRMHKAALKEVGPLINGPMTAERQHALSKAGTLHEVMRVVRLILKVSNGGVSMD